MEDLLFFVHLYFFSEMFAEMLGLLITYRYIIYITGNNMCFFFGDKCQGKEENQGLRSAVFVCLTCIVWCDLNWHHNMYCFEVIIGSSVVISTRLVSDMNTRVTCHSFARVHLSHQSGHKRTAGQWRPMRPWKLPKGHWSEVTRWVVVKVMLCSCHRCRICWLRNHLRSKPWSFHMFHIPSGLGLLFQEIFVFWKGWQYGQHSGRGIIPTKLDVFQVDEIWW